MAVKIKLKRLGKIREPYYRIVVADSRTKRDGRAIEEIGKYHPKAEPSVIEVNSERVQHWLSVGAQPTDPVRVLLKITGDWQKFTGEPGAEGTLRTAEPKADKKERFAAVASQSQATKDDKASGQGKAGTQSRAAKPARDGAAGRPHGRCRKGRCRQGQCRQGQCRQGQCRQGQCRQGQCRQGQCRQGQCRQGQCRQGQCRQGQCRQGRDDQGRDGQGCTKLDGRRRRGKGHPGQGRGQGRQGTEGRSGRRGRCGDQCDD